MYNAEEYTISVRKECIDDDVYWVARVDELPDVMEFGETRDEAYDLAVDTINTGQEMCLSEGIDFPTPKTFAETSASGRVTLRLPKSVHANCIARAEADGVSLNTYILTCIASYRQTQETSIFDELKKSILALAAPRGHVELLRHAAYAYSKKGQFNVVLSGDDPSSLDVMALNTKSAFKEIKLQGWDAAALC